MTPHVKRQFSAAGLEHDQYLHLNGTEKFSDRDECLVWQYFLNGDDDSLIYFYNKYVDVLYSYGKQLTDKYEMIRDCIQELFCDLIDTRTKLSGAQSVKAYLMASLKRRILRELKKNSRYLQGEEGFHFAQSESPISMVLELKDADLKIIHEKLNLLSVNQREAIYLYFYEGLSYREIAGILKIKVTSARMLTYRALESLQKHLTPYMSSFYSVILIISQY